MEVQCPRCEKKFTIPDSEAGHEVRCSDCQHVFAAGEPAAEGGEKPEPEPLASSERPEGAQAAVGPPPLKPQREAVPSEEGPPGPPSLPGKRPGEARAVPAKLTGPVLIALGAAGALLVICVVVVALATAGGGKVDYACYVPEDATFVGYFDAAAIVHSGVFEKTGGALDDLHSDLKQALRRLNAKEEDISEVFVGMAGGDGPVVVIRTKRDVDLDELVRDEHAELRAHKGMEYMLASIGYGRTYVAKTGRRTYCFAGDQEAIENAMDQSRRKEKRDLSRDLQRASKEVSGEDHYIVVYAGDTFAGAKAAGLGFSINSRVRGKLAIVFGEKDAAKDFEEKAKTDLKEQVERGQEALKDLEGDRRTFAKLALGILKGIKIQRSGDLVRITAGCELKDISRMAEASEEGMEEVVAGIRRAFVVGVR